jgi:glyoxylase-like metal-dependent hydrolase (beta-lactamase superfamily II)
MRMPSPPPTLHSSMRMTASRPPSLVSLLLAAVLAFALLPAAAKAPEIALKPVMVSAHGWYFQGGAGMASAQNRGYMSNAGFVVTPEGVVVFDALGTPALGEAMLAAIRTVTRQPVRRVIVSHYHADHVYGLQPFKAAGAEIWAHRKSLDYFTSGQAEERLAQRRRDLFPWVDDRTRVLRPDFLFDGDVDFRLGGLTFRLLYAEGAHSPEDVMLYVAEDRLLFAGDLLFAGRVPFVGNADSKGWLLAMDKMIAQQPAVVVPGHGAASHDVQRDLVLTRDYLLYLRETMGKAVAELEPFDEAYARTDWSRFKGLPAFEQTNRINAYGTYLLLEQEALKGGGR